MDPKQERQSANRGAAFWGNLVITPANAPRPPLPILTERCCGSP
jgi:hypothetical protein